MKKRKYLNTNIFTGIAGVVDVFSILDFFEGITEIPKSHLLYAIIILTIIAFVLICYRLIHIGPNGEICNLFKYLRYKVYNLNGMILSVIHKKDLHLYFEIKENIKALKAQKGSFESMKAEIEKFVEMMNKTLNVLFKIDLSIKVRILSEENGNFVLKPFMFLSSGEESAKCGKERENFTYLIEKHENFSIRALADCAEDYNKLHGNQKYCRNNLFEYVLSNNRLYYISNDLDAMEENFFTSSSNYPIFYKSMAVFAISKPASANDVMGLLTFDTTHTNVFSDKECTHLMGIFTHQLYELLIELFAYEQD